MNSLNLSLVLGVEFEVLFEVQVLHTIVEYTSDNVDGCIRVVRLGPVLVNDRRSSQCESNHQGFDSGSRFQMACPVLSGLGLNALIVVASHGSRDHIRSQSADRQTRQI